MSDLVNGAWHCHGCIWSAFDLKSGPEEAAAEAAQHNGIGCDVYRCHDGHTA